MTLYDYCVRLLSLFLIPFQAAFTGSVFGSVFLVIIVACPVLFLFRIWRYLK